jgi:putative lipoic acid-binding regulatory protein
MNMADTPPPKIEFPCAYPLKVVGHAAPDFRDFVVAVMHRHTDNFDETLVEVRPSSGGKFVSVRVTITARGEEHLQTIFAELKGSGRVQIVI